MTTENNEKFEDKGNRNPELKRFYRHLSQGISIVTREGVDISTPVGDLMEQGADVRVVGMEGNAIYTHGKKTREIPVQFRLTDDVDRPNFSFEIGAGAILDVSSLRFAVDIDYSETLFPIKTEKFVKPKEIKDDGELSSYGLEKYKSYTPEERFAWLNTRLVYLANLKKTQERELEKLVYRYEQNGKKLYDARHTLLLNRIDGVSKNIEEAKSWLNITMLDLEMAGVTSEGFKNTVKV